MTLVRRGERHLAPVLVPAHDGVQVQVQLQLHVEVQVLCHLPMPGCKPTLEPGKLLFFM